jgi:hypothetical protein
MHIWQNKTPREVPWGVARSEAHPYGGPPPWDPDAATPPSSSRECTSLPPAYLHDPRMHLPGATAVSRERHSAGVAGAVGARSGGAYDHTHACCTTGPWRTIAWCARAPSRLAASKTSTAAPRRGCRWWDRRCGAAPSCGGRQRQGRLWPFRRMACTCMLHRSRNLDPDLVQALNAALKSSRRHPKPLNPDMSVVGNRACSWSGSRKNWMNSGWTGDWTCTKPCGEEEQCESGLSAGTMH